MMKFVEKSVIVATIGLLLAGCAAHEVPEKVDLNTKFKTGGYVQKAENFMIILDTSGSMAEIYNGKDMLSFSKSLVRRLNEKIPRDMKLIGALRTFGVGASYGAKDTDLVYWPVEYSKEKFEKSLDKIQRVSGKSHLYIALEAATEDLKTLEGRTVLIIFSDGKIDEEKSVLAAEKIKDAYDGMCIHTVHVQTNAADIHQNAADREKLDRVAKTGECGYSVNSDDILSDKDMAVFVEKVFFDKDSDRDGVGDRLDDCPDTPPELAVDEKGCPRDIDGDGVTDESDRCPDTPAGIKVDDGGCPLDGDEDGVPDYLDKCPNTPNEIQVGPQGCPLDSDADDVPDYLDKCPNTPRVVKVDVWGCPVDSDGDGVPDSLDECPGTPAGAQVGPRGCAIDSDGDGVFDYADECPNTPKRTTVDEKGCPGAATEIYKGAVFGDTGIKKTEPAKPMKIPSGKHYEEPPAGKIIIDDVGYRYLGGILYSPDESEIHPLCHPYLDRVAARMKENSDMKIIIQGHTDDIEKQKDDLSVKRARIVMEYFLEKGVEATRVEASGHGDQRPRNSNASPVGQADNRRVEIKTDR